MKSPLLITVLVYLLSVQPGKSATVDSIATPAGRLDNIYMGLGFDLCNTGLGYSINGTFILKNQWGGNVRYNFNAVDSGNMPDDYYDFVLFVPFLSNGLPNDKYHIISLSAVKNFLFNTKYLRAGIEFGPSVVIGQIAYYTPVIDPVPFLGSNYEMERANKVVAGISARGKLECPALSVVGIELALFTNINRFNSFIGGDFCINLGMVR